MTASDCKCGTGPAARMSMRRGDGGWLQPRGGQVGDSPFSPQAPSVPALNRQIERCGS
jgi:hypothetical protein